MAQHAYMFGFIFKQLKCKAAIVLVFVCLYCVFHWNALERENCDKSQSKDIVNSVSTKDIPSYRENGRYINSSNKTVLIQNINAWHIRGMFDYYSTQQLGSLLHIQLSTSYKIDLIYPTFNFTKPRFVTYDDERLFMNNNISVVHLGRQKSFGTLALIQDGKVDSSIDCGAESDLKLFTSDKVTSSVNQPMAMFSPLLVPDGQYFQHFLDGVLPKISQIYDLIHKYNITLVLPSPVDPIIKQFLTEMNIYPKYVTWYSKTLTKNPWQLNSCITPRMHPLLWQRGRSLLGCGSEIKENDIVVLILRRQTRNGGRKILNEAEIVNFLQKRYKESFIVFTGGLNFTESRKLFQKARIVIGVHGGGLYNINMAPSSVTVVEIMPTDRHGAIPRGLAHTMIWRMAQVLDQIYWRIPASPIKSDVSVPLNKLVRIMDITDTIHLKNKTITEYKSGET